MKIQRVKFKDIEQIPQFSIRQHFKQDFQGSSPSVFIGRVGYPTVNIGILSPQYQGDVSKYDSPKLWSEQQLPIGTIAGMRYELVNSRTRWNINDVHTEGKIKDIIQEIGMAKRPVDLEVRLKKRPTVSVNPENWIIPFGPGAEVRNVRATSNPAVDSRVERAVADTDLKAGSAILSLYKKGFEESALNKLLSVGTLGLKCNRKFVPTRWSITAVDDTIGKRLIQEIKDFPPGDCQCYFGGGWGNYYLVLLFSEIWRYELFETYLGQSVNPWSTKGYFYSTDYEGYEGRKAYADETAGGYYAARLPVLEKMKWLKRQHSALVLRFITSEYNVPLGVWVCREAVRNAMQEKPVEFSTPELMLRYAHGAILRKWGFDIRILLQRSRLLHEKKEQRKLDEFS